MSADKGALADQAWAAASKIVDTYMSFGEPDSEDRVHCIAMAAVAWIEGRDAGGQEAIATIQGRMHG